MLERSGAKGVPCVHDGYTPDDITNYLGMFNAVFSLFALVFLFVIYRECSNGRLGLTGCRDSDGRPLLRTVLLEKDPNAKMFKGDSPAAAEIEAMIDHYISLKTYLSFATGCLVAVMLMLCGIQMAVLFGIMSFVMNYIPNVGSIIAIFLPLPVVLLDFDLAGWQQAGAFIGPGIVQLVVGNVVEPQLFGSSLNMTPLSILAALLIWTAVRPPLPQLFTPHLIVTPYRLHCDCAVPMRSCGACPVRSCPCRCSASKRSR